MKNVCLTIRHCPEEIHRALRQNARFNKRSLNAETIHVLSQSVREKSALSERDLLKTIQNLPLTVKFSEIETRLAIREGRK